MRKRLTKFGWNLECWAVASFPGRVFRPEDACPRRFSWFFNWIPKVQKRVNLVDLVKGFQTRERDSYSNEYSLEKFGVDTAENGPLKVCKIT